MEAPFLGLAIILIELPVKRLPVETEQARLLTLKAAWNGDRSALAPATFRKRVQRATERLRAAWRSRHGTS